MSCNWWPRGPLSPNVTSHDWRRVSFPDRSLPGTWLLLGLRGLDRALYNGNLETSWKSARKKRAKHKWFIMFPCFLSFRWPQADFPCSSCFKIKFSFGTCLRTSLRPAERSRRLERKDGTLGPSHKKVCSTFSVTGVMYKWAMKKTLLLSIILVV